MLLRPHAPPGGNWAIWIIAFPLDLLLGRIHRSLWPLIFCVARVPRLSFVKYRIERADISNVILNPSLHLTFVTPSSTFVTRNHTFVTRWPAFDFVESPVRQRLADN